MYRVMVVDDEKPGREILKYLIDWDKTNFTICATAKHGKDALQQYDLIKPDLIITDIQMPVMDGLEMISNIKEINKDQEIIIVSCYEDFSYAQKAIRLGITDYLIKGLVSQEDLYSVLCKIEEKLSRHTKVNVSSFNSETHSYIGNQEIIETLFFEELPLSNIEQMINDNSLNICGKSFVVMCVSIDRYSQLINQHEIKHHQMRSIQSLIHNSLQMKQGGECVYCGNGNFMVIAPIKNIHSQMSFINECMTLANSIRNNLSKHITKSVTIAVSNSFCHLTEIHKNVQHTLDMLEYRIFAGTNKTILFNTYLQRIKNINPEKINNAISKAKHYLSNKDFESFRSQINLMFNVEIRGFMQLHYLKYINSCLIDAVILFANKNDLPYDRIFGCNYIPIDKISNFQTIGEIVQWYDVLVNHIINLCNSYVIESENVIIKEAIKYIKKHFDQGSISLDSIASHVNVHKVYLCRIFKQETGLTISKYNALLKVEKSKELLKDTSLKISEVSNMSGFSSPSKFNVAFKNITGQTPRRYRESIFPLMKA